jgi:hypothetical protein
MRTPPKVMRARSHEMRKTSKIRYCEEEIWAQDERRKTDPRIEGGEVRRHVPEIGGLGADILLEL